MTILFATRARLPEGCASQVRLKITDGRIAHIMRDADSTGAGVYIDCLLPAMARASGD